MNGRFVAAMALLLATAAFSGCIEALASLSSQDTEVTASANRDLADSAAAAWRPDAQLRGVFAMENPNLTGEFPSDANVGNGRAPAWIYGYAAGNESAYRAFQVTADGQVRVVEDTVEGAPDVGRPLDGWAVDSDAAVQTARANATFESVAGQPEAFLMEALGAEKGAILWVLMAATPQGQALAIVDAVDGTLIMAQSMSMGFEMPPMPFWDGPSWDGPQVEIEDRGTLDRSNPHVEHAFTIGRPDVAHFAIETDHRLPTDALRWAILDADGNALVEGRAGGDFTERAMYKMTFDLETAGEYMLVLTYESAPVVGFLGAVEYELRLVVGAMPDVNVEY